VPPHSNVILKIVAKIEASVEIRNRRTEVIFLVIDDATESPNDDPHGSNLPDDQFFATLPDFS